MNTKKLKELVLDLAIHGKLVPQDPNDEPASVLLERIQAEKAKTAKGKKSTASEPIGDVPFEVPEGWCWTPLKDICSKLVDGDHNPPKGENNPTRYLMASSKNINNNRLVDLNDVRYLSEDVFIECDKRTEVSIGDIAITSVGTLGRSCIIDKDYKITFQRSVTVISLIKVLNYFVKYYFDSPYIQNFMSENSRGTAQQGFYINQMEVLLVPLPPLAEQQRIVAEIERWFKVIDALEGNEGDLLKSIEQTKKKVLDLAIHGKLVPQDPNDEPASVLLERIQAEKAKTAKGKKSATSEPIDDVPFEVPEGWKWTRLSNLAHIFGRIGFRGYTKEDLVEKGKGAITLSPSNIVNGKMDFSYCTYISWFKYDESPEIMIFNGDIIIVKTGSSYGKCALVDNLPEKATINPQSVVLKNIICNRNFLTFCLQSEYARNEYDEFVLGTAIPTFTQVKLGEMLIPLPPLPEQRRIVAKIEEIFGELDKIKEMVG